MGNDRILMGILSVALSFSTAACQGKAASGEKAADSAAPVATGKAPEAAPPKASPTLTKGELVSGKSKVTFTIALPPGLQLVDEGMGRSMVSYRKGKNDFEGYGVSVGLDHDGKRTLATGKAAILAEFERQKAAKKGTMLEQGDWDGGGWYMAASLEERGKPFVTMMSRVAKGDVVLMCRGDGEGQVAKTPAATAKVLVEACKSLTITSS